MPFTATRTVVAAVMTTSAVLGSSAAPPATATTADDRLYVDTIKAWDGTTSLYPFNAGRATQTYGQTITAPERTTVLGSFTFLVDLTPSTQFRAYLYAWDAAGVHAVRAALWASRVRATATFDWSPVKFYVHRNLVAGQRYVVFLSTLGVEQPMSKEDGYFALVDTGEDLYPGGSRTWFNDGRLRALSTGRPWADETTSADLAFRAKFLTP